MTPDAAPPEERRFPCDQCGADYRFAPDRGELVCDHCGHAQTIAHSGPWQSSIREFDFDRALAQDLPEQEIEETRVLSCPNCAAQVEFDASLHAAECPFCATPVVTDTGTHRHIKPAAVGPFVLEEPQAHDAMERWLGSLWFAPNGLTKYVRKGQKMNGVYVPFWTIDAQTDTAYTG